MLVIRWMNTGMDFMGIECNCRYKKKNFIAESIVSVSVMLRLWWLVLTFFAYFLNYFIIIVWIYLNFNYWKSIEPTHIKLIKIINIRISCTIHHLSPFPPSFFSSFLSSFFRNNSLITFLHSKWSPPTPRQNVQNLGISPPSNKYFLNSLILYSWCPWCPCVGSMLSCFYISFFIDSNFMLYLFMLLISL